VASKDRVVALVVVRAEAAVVRAAVVAAVAGAD